MCIAWCPVTTQLTLAIIIMIILMTKATLRTHFVCSQYLKAKDHFTLPWTSEKAADREDTKHLALENA